MSRAGDVVAGTAVRALATEGLPWQRTDESRTAASQCPLCVGRAPNGWVPGWYESGQIGQPFFDAETRPPSTVSTPVGSVVDAFRVWGCYS